MRGENVPLVWFRPVPLLELDTLVFVRVLLVGLVFGRNGVEIIVEFQLLIDFKEWKEILSFVLWSEVIKLQNLKHQ